jgi:hypothetical protein
MTSSAVRTMHATFILLLVLVIEAAAVAVAFAAGAILVQGIVEEVSVHVVAAAISIVLLLPQRGIGSGTLVCSSNTHPSHACPRKRLQCSPMATVFSSATGEWEHHASQLWQSHSHHRHVPVAKMAQGANAHLKRASTRLDIRVLEEKLLQPE